MKKYLLIVVLLLVLATVSGQVFAGKMVSINFAQGGNQNFAGGNPIGPFATNSANWNNTNDRTTGELAAGTMDDLKDNLGVPTGINVAWQSSTVYWAGNTSDDEHKLAVGYLDDGDSGSGKGVTITLTNIPYSNYSVCGLYTTDQGDTATVNFDVNGTWTLGGDAATTADVYGTINACNSATGQYWVQIDPGVTRGNYWIVDASGETCTVTGELKNDTSRGTLAGLIIVSDEPSQRSYSVNFCNMGSGWEFHEQISWSSVPLHIAGYENEPNKVPYYFQPTSGWNDMKFSDTPKGQLFEIGDQDQNYGSAFLITNQDFSWNTNTGGDNVNNSLPDADDATKNLARLTARFFGHYPGSHSADFDPIASVKRVPYGKYHVIAYLNVNGAHENKLKVEDTTYYYVGEPSVDFKARLLDPNTPNWLMATDTEGPSAEVANIAVFKDLSATDLELMFKSTSNSGIDAFQIIAAVSADDIVTQVAPGNVNKDLGGTPVPLKDENENDTIIEWNTPVNGAASYDVFFGEYGNPDPNFVLELVSEGQTETIFVPVLDYGLSYAWRVDTNIGGETITGDYFYFDTVGDPLIEDNGKPNSVSVQEGTDTFFTIDALLTENYVWYRSDDAVTDTPEDDIELQSESYPQLDIAGVTEEDVAFYYCVLTNTIPASKEVVSEVASLEIGKLELYLPFDGDPNDASGNGWDAVQGNRDADPALGTVSYDVGYDGVGQAVKFTRESGDQLEVLGSDDYFNFYPKGFTVRLWVKPNDIGGPFVNYISKHVDKWRMYSTGRYYGVGVTAKMSPLSLATPPGRIDDGNWHMLACTYDGATETMSVYQEGFLQGTRTGALDATNSYPVTIGSYYKTGTGGQSYDGLIDEVEIFSYPISQLEMIEDYAAKTGQTYCLEEILGDVNGDCKVNMDDLALVADQWLDSTNPGTATPAELASRVVSWQFDETSGMVATDSSGNSIDGTLGAGFTTGQWIADGGRTGTAGDNALYMDGSADTSVIAAVADPNALPYAGNIFRGTDTWTMNIWVKYATGDAANAMTNIGGFGQNEWYGAEGASIDSDRYFASYAGGYEVELGQTGLFPSNPLGADWQMMTATYDGTVCVVYLDGVQVSQATVTLVDTAVNEINLNTARRILWDAWDNTNKVLLPQTTVPMNAYVDDFSIWDEAFNAEQVAGMYTNSFISCDGALDADLNGDCVIDLVDFALMAGDWLECNLIPSSLCD